MVGACRSLKPSGVLEYCGLPLTRSSLTNDENSSPLRFDHVLKIDGLPFSQRFLVLRCELYRTDFFRYVDFSRFRIVARILEPACNFVHGNERRKQFAVLSFHILYKDGVSFVQRFELHGGKRYTAKRLLVESLVFRENKFDASSFRIVLQIALNSLP